MIFTNNENSKLTDFNKFWILFEIFDFFQKKKDLVFVIGSTLPKKVGQKCDEKSTLGGNWINNWAEAPPPTVTLVSMYSKNVRYTTYKPNFAHH